MTSLPDFTRPADPEPDFHCKRCHRDIAGEKYLSHYRACTGFTSDCWPWCKYDKPINTKQ